MDNNDKSTENWLLTIALEGGVIRQYQLNRKEKTLMKELINHFKNYNLGSNFPDKQKSIYAIDINNTLHLILDLSKVLSIDFYAID